MTDIFEILKKLCSVSGVCGFESGVSAAIRALAEPYADEMYSDVTGNLIARKRGSGRRIMVTAHMDTSGFIVTFIETDGLIRIAPVGGAGVTALENRMVVFPGGTVGVTALRKNPDRKDPLILDYAVDIGAKDEAEARGLVSPGDPVSFPGDAVMAGERVLSPNLSGRAGCAVLLSALEALGGWAPIDDVYFVFAAQGEFGSRGASAAAFSIEPDMAISVGVTGAAVFPDDVPKSGIVLGGGPAIKIMDSSLISDPAVVKALEDAAAREGISCQREVLEYPASAAGPFHLSRSGVPTGGIGIPARYVRLPFEMASLGDVESCARLLASVLGQGRRRGA